LELSGWIFKFCGFTSSFSNRCGYARPHVSRFVAFSKVSTRSGERFSKICGYGLHIRAKRNRNKMFADSNEIKVLTENFTYKSKSIAWKFYLSK
jgi:hypothetical protein